MQHEQKKPEYEPCSETAHSELSETWQQLLGGHVDASHHAASPAERVLPTLDIDPWSELLHDKGVEIVDLQRVRLQVSDQEVEELLQLMQEQPAQPLGDDASTLKHE